MKKKFTMLLALVFCAFTSSVMAQYYTPGERTLTLEAGKKYFIGAATFFGNARYNLLYNNGGTLAYSDIKPNVVTTDAVYLFTVEEVGENNTYYIKNSDNKYLQSGDKASTETKTAITVVPYNSVKGTVTCTDDVQACDKNGDKIEYNDIADNTPIVCVYNTTDKGWRHINGFEIGKSTAFAFYEAVELEAPFEVTTNVNSPIYYTIKNMRAGNYAEYDGTTRAMLLKSSVTSAANLFYFTAGTTPGTYKIHNAATSNKCAATNSWTTDGIDWYIKQSENTDYSGFAISKEETLTASTEQAWNDFQGNGTSIAYWGGNDAGSVWTIEKYTGEIHPIMSTESEKHLYFIKNDRVNKFANYVASGSAFTETAASNYGSYWYFVEKTDAEGVPAGFKACYIYNAANDKPVQNHSNGFMSAPDDATYPAKVYLVGFHDNSYFGYVIYELGNENNGWNDLAGGSVTTYKYDDAGSIWSIIPADKTEAQLKSEAATAKSNALALITNAINADYYSYADEAIATVLKAIKDVDVSTLASATTALLDNKIASPLNTLKAAERGTAAPAVGAYIQLKNRQYGKYLNAGESTLSGVDNSKSLSTLWLVEAGDNANVKLKNVGTGKYIGEIRQSKDVSMVESENAKQFAWTNQTDIYGVFKETTGGDYAYGHIAGHNVLVGWEANADASQWVVSKVTIPEEDTYYLIECPVFEQTQGVKKALYSNGTNPGWKTLDTADKSFYWTVEKTETGSYLKNCNDGKYVLGQSANQTGWTMAEETTGAEYTIEIAGDGQVFIKITDRHLHANNHGGGAGSGSNIVSWETNSSNSASAWKFVSTENPDLILAIAALQNRVDELQFVVDNATGEIGYYKPEATAVSEHIVTAQAVLDGDSKDIATYTEALAALNTAAEGVDLSVVLPAEGKFYRIMNDNGSGYLSGNAATSDRVQFVAGIGELASSVFYFEGGKLMSYVTGLYLAKGSTENFVHYTTTVGAAAGIDFTFKASKVVGKLLIEFNNNGRSFYSNAVGKSNAAGSGQDADYYRFTVTEVEWLPVAINAEVGYATFYSPVELALSENRVKAYTGKVDGDVLKLTEQNVVPANTGVILELQENATVENGYTFLQVKETTLTGLDNDLTGTFAKTYVTDDAYVLANGTKGVGLYRAKMNVSTDTNNDGTVEEPAVTYEAFLNNAFKAYLPASVSGNAPAMFSFGRGGDDAEDTTGIETTVNGEQATVIYDLAGRRVAKMEKGIYIVNGRKVVIR